ncbi:MAG: response regulator receiver protein [Bacteroidetes bacterium]|jgi:CheY-like chemotaxis protein|nr:response regulator receiver protein [Bacteroidota bacterium]
MRSKNSICLLIDDDNDDHEFFTEAVEALNCKVELIHARSGREALSLLEKMSKHFPDFIFLDLNMPAMNGMECLRKIKADARLKDIPVVMYSTSSNSNDISTSMANGAIDYVIKPSSISTLVSSLKKFFK